MEVLRGGCCKDGGIVVAVESYSARTKKGCCCASSHSIETLRGVSLVALPCTVTAVIGASEGGRSALISALAGYGGAAGQRGIHAFRLVHNSDVEAAGATRTSPCCPVAIARMSYVDWADDHLLPHLTVEETINMAAELRLFQVDNTSRQTAAEAAIAAMGLQLCRKTRVGNLGNRGISTGERRRLAIALELLDVEKQVLVLNRPTTGLDSAHARIVIEQLGCIAREENRTVIVALDQPSSAVLNACDSVVLLHDGRLIFQGSPEQLLEFLQRVTNTPSLPEGYGASDFVFDVIDSLNDQEAAPTEESGSDSTFDNLPSVARLQERFNQSGEAEFVRVTLLSLLVDGCMPNGGPAAVPVRLSATAPAVQAERGCASRFVGRIWKFMRSVETLCKRSLLNTSRTSLVWAPLLIALVQGVLMGFIMFRYGRWLPTPDADAAPIIAPEVWQSPLYDIAKNGVALDEVGKPIRPVLDMLVHGIDGHGNNWLWDIANYRKEVPDATPADFDPEGAALQFGRELQAAAHRQLRVEEHYFFLYLRQTVRCTREKWQLAEMGYPSVEVGNSAQGSGGALDPDQLASDMLIVMQMLDYMWNRLDWTAASQCSKTDWICLASKAGGLAEDVLTCGGFKPMPRALGINLAGKPPVIPFPAAAQPTGAPQLRRLDVAKVYDVLQMLRDYVKAPPNKYDGDLAEIDHAISKKYWKRFFDITESLVPGYTLPELVALLLSPETAGDLSNLPNRQTLTDLSETLGDLWTWLNSEKGKPVGPPYSSVEETAGICKNEFCQLVKLSVVRVVRQTVNRAKIEGALRMFPRLVVNAWNALTATGALFAMTAALAFFCVDVLLSFASMRSMMNRESFNGLYTPGALFLARNLVDLPNQVLPAFLLAMIWGLMSEVVNGAKQVFTLVGISVSVLFAAYGLCYLASAVTPRLEVAMVLTPLVLMSWVIVSGFIMRDTELLPVWTRWFRYISFHRFGWFASMINAFPRDRPWGDLPGKAVLWVMGVPSDAQISTQVGWLLTLGVISRAAACVAFYCFYRGAGITVESKTDE